MRQTNHCLKYFQKGLGILLSFGLASCADYSISVNDNTVYDPPKIFTQFRVADSNLQRCIDETIKEEKITNAKQLRNLQCPNKDIQVLDGLAIFSELKILGLAGNPLKNIDDVAALKLLEQLDLQASGTIQLTKISGLKLDYLNLSENPDLHCDDFQQLMDIKSLIKPEHCK